MTAWVPTCEVPVPEGRPVLVKTPFVPVALVVMQRVDGGHGRTWVDMDSPGVNGHDREMMFDLAQVTHWCEVPQ